MPCLFCDSKISSAGSVFCRKHLLRNRKKARERTALLRSQGLCVKCGLHKPKPGKSTCRKCIKKWAIRFRNEQKRRKRNGLCLRCGKFLATSHAICKTCRAKRNRFRRNQDFFMRKARTVISSDYTKLGRRTGPKAKELAEQLRKIWAEQKGICPLSGRKLSRKTAELDHIKPRSKGGKSKPVNLRFLHKDVNQAMRALTDKSFIELCKEVAKRAGAG